MSEAYLATFALDMSGMYLDMHLLSLITIGFVDELPLYFTFDP